MLSFQFWLVATTIFLNAIALFVHPLPVSKDPFYQQPSDIHKYQLGDIIKVRNAPAPIQVMYVDLNVKNIWQFGIRSEDHFGRPQAVFSTVVEPHNADPSKIFSHQLGQDSALPGCSPSYNLLQGETDGAFYTKNEAIVMEWALKKGWYINIPNHEGPDGAFCVGPQGGRILLDSIRAILASGETTGVSKNASVVMWGYSGGTIPTGWASTMLPDYAPELADHVIGAAVGGWVVNVTATAEAADGTFWSGLIPNAINGIVQGYPHIRPYIFGDLHGNQASEFHSAHDLCLIPSVVKFLFTRFFTGATPWFSKRFDVINQPEVKPVVNEISLGLNENVTVPSVPFYIFQSVGDDVVPYAPAEKLYNRFCADGAESVEFAQMEKPDHVFSFLEGSSPSLLWVEDRFAGKAPVSGCKKYIRPHREERFGAAIPYHRMLGTALTLLSGEEIGPDTPLDEAENAIKRVISEKLRAAHAALGLN